MTCSSCITETLHHSPSFQTLATNIQNYEDDGDGDDGDGDDGDGEKLLDLVDMLMA
jgi:hypothetical protein